MTESYLKLTALDPIVARDGRPFGIGQGNRMKGMGWPYPSVVAGSFRTALVKATGRDFSSTMPEELMKIPVAGVFPVAETKLPSGADGVRENTEAGNSETAKNLLYLPAPSDCVVEEIWREVIENGEKKKKKDYIAHRAAPAGTESGEGCDWPDKLLLRPVVIDREGDFKPYDKAPAWWSVGMLEEWLTTNKLQTMTNGSFLSAANLQVRDHVQLIAETGAAAESRLFATAGLSLTHLPRFGVEEGSFEDKYAEITLSARIEAAGWDISKLNMLHPLGGERRLVHWGTNGAANLWECPKGIKDALLARPGRVRMMLATPAVFEYGWRPRWIDEKTLTATPPGFNGKLKLVGVSIARWKAVSGWSLLRRDNPAEPGKSIKPGPKPIKRLVPAGGVYFFETTDDASSLSDRWLQPVSDDPQDCNDGFGLAVWGTW